MTDSGDSHAKPSSAASSRIEAGGHVFTVKLAQLAPAQLVERPAASE